MKNAITFVLSLGLLVPLAACERRDFDRSPAGAAEERNEARDDVREEAQERSEEVREETRERNEEMLEDDAVEEMREGDIEVEAARRGESDLEQSTRGLQADDDEEPTRGE